MQSPESYGFPDSPLPEMDTAICNDLEDYMDGCVNSMIITSGIATVAVNKRTAILTIKEENDSGVGDELTLTIKLPADIWPEDIELSQVHKYVLALVRVRE